MKLKLQQFNLLTLILFLLYSCSTLDFRAPDSTGPDDITCNEALESILLNDPTSLKTGLTKELSSLPAKTQNEILLAIDGVMTLPFSSTFNDVLGMTIGNKSLKELSYVKEIHKDGGLKGLFRSIGSLFKKNELASNYQQVKQAKEFLRDNGLSYKVDGSRNSISELGKAYSKNFSIRKNAQAKTWSLEKSQVEDLQNHPYVKLGSTSNPTQVKIKPIEFDDIGDDVLRELDQVDPDLAAEVRSLSRDASAKAATKEKVMARVVEALVDKKMDWLTRQMSLFETVRSPEQLKTVIRAVSETYRDLSLLQPFGDDSSVLLREILLSHTLISKGVPPARMLNVPEDAFRTLDQTYNDVIQGVYSGQRLFKDIANRIKLGLPISQSPEWLTPHMMRHLTVELQKQGSVKTVDFYKTLPVDPKQFIAWFRNYYSNTPGLAQRIQANPRKELVEIQEAFRDWSYQHKKLYLHKKEGEVEISLNFIDPDFMSYFGRYTADTPSKYQAKLDQWYLDERVWRGTSFTHREFTEPEIVSVFKNVSQMLLSNSAMGQFKRSGGAQGIEVVKGQFHRYNESLYNNDVTRMATDHQTEGELYRKSYGYSTSRNYQVGRAFAAGAMKIADYGQQYDPELQKLLKSRILVGFSRGKKDVPFNKLRIVAPDFRSTYPRQREVMGIGGVDPDTVDVVHSLGGEEGKTVLLSYIRNPEKPNEVLKIEGEAYPEDDLSTHKILDRFNLDGV